MIKTRLDRKATNISVLGAIGVRRDGQKVLLSIRNMGSESTAAWRQFLTGLDARGLRRPEFVIVDGAPGVEAALVAPWGKSCPSSAARFGSHRNLLGHAPSRLQDELSEDDRAMIYADTAAQIETRRKAFRRNGSASAGPWPRTWSKPAAASSASPALIPKNENRQRPPKPSSA